MLHNRRNEGRIGHRFLQKKTMVEKTRDGAYRSMLRKESVCKDFVSAKGLHDEEMVQFIVCFGEVHLDPVSLAVQPNGLVHVQH